MSTEENELRERAEKRAEEIIGFRVHLAMYLSVNLVIFLIWLVIGLFTDSWFPWFVFPLAGWGIGVFFHGVGVYRSRGMEERKRQMVEKELARLKEERGQPTAPSTASEKGGPEKPQPPP